MHVCLYVCVSVYMYECVCIGVFHIKKVYDIIMYYYALDFFLWVSMYFFKKKNLVIKHPESLKTLYKCPIIIFTITRERK